MGTRSITILKDDDEKHTEICVMYCQYDGYPSGHGKELADFLKDKIITNGIQKGNTANGGGCLAAQVVAFFKNDSGVGGIYLHRANTRNVWEEYRYTVIPTIGQTVVLRVETQKNYPSKKWITVFEDHPDKYNDFLEIQAKE